MGPPAIVENRLNATAPDIRLPDLREEIAQCERRGLMHDACMARYIDLERSDINKD